MLHIFKIRYLDYYEVVKDDTLVEEVVTEVEAVNVEDEKDKKILSYIFVGVVSFSIRNYRI